MGFKPLTSNERRAARRVQSLRVEALQSRELPAREQFARYLAQLAGVEFPALAVVPNDTVLRYAMRAVAALEAHGYGIVRVGTLDAAIETAAGKVCETCAARIAHILGEALAVGESQSWR